MVSHPKYSEKNVLSKTRIDVKKHNKKPKKDDSNKVDINPYKVNFFNVFIKFPKKCVMVLISAILYNVAVVVFLTKAATIATGLSAVVQAITYPVLLLSPYFAYLYLLINLPLIIGFWKKNSRLFMILTTYWMIFQVILQSFFLIPEAKAAIHQISIYYINWSSNAKYSSLVPWDAYGQYGPALLNATSISVSQANYDVVKAAAQTLKPYIDANGANLSATFKNNIDMITASDSFNNLIKNNNITTPIIISMSDFLKASYLTGLFNKSEFINYLNFDWNISNPASWELPAKEYLENYTAADVAKLNYFQKILYDKNNHSMNLANLMKLDMEKIYANYGQGFSNPTWPIIVYTVIAGVMAGCASGLAWKNSASAAGSDVIVYYISRMKQKSVGKTSTYVSFFFCGVSILVIAVLEGIGLAQGKPLNVGALILRILSSIGYIFLYTAFIELIYPKYKKIKIEIHTKEPDKIISRFKEINYWHGFNIETVTGGFTNTTTIKIETYTLFLEFNQIKKEVLSVDPNAWITVLQVKNVVGKFDTSRID
ncbi:YitT family protein [Metamycoplasma neophronis]|uniref:DUF2179 domain-containing protein n=1 Tax=Metamycoplasma neophronis TaxID=872983 RepID=A0ABY2Z0D6_9BACT|nr:YitT family protein [Metamycoplasma neophronis]TPR53901.1 DUF2179 domain-containing protein [Metamycoplasma neophronis]